MTRLPRHRRTVSGWVAAALFAVFAFTLTSSPALSAGNPVDEVHYTFTSGTSVALDWRGTPTT